MSSLFTFKRTKGDQTHYVASVIPKTTVVEKFTPYPDYAAKFKEDDAKALMAALEGDAKVSGRWAVLDADGREVSVFTHATPVPVMKSPVLGPPSSAAAADRLLADEPDHSPFRELAELVPFDARPEEKLGDVVTAAIGEIKALRESLDELTAPPKDDDTAVIDTTTGPAK